MYDVKKKNLLDIKINETLEDILKYLKNLDRNNNIEKIKRSAH